jgi:hypothetical protein
MGEGSDITTDASVARGARIRQFCLCGAADDGRQGGGFLVLHAVMQGGLDARRRIMQS